MSGKDFREPKDFRQPYESLVGVWNGLGQVFDIDGKNLGALPIMAVIYWLDEDTLLYRQSRPTISAQRGLLLTIKSFWEQFELKVTGRLARGGNERLDVKGMNGLAGEYYFQLRRRDGSGVHYNHHVFKGPDHRTVYGPLVDSEGETDLVITTEFTRVSYTVSQHEKEL